MPGNVDIVADGVARGWARHPVHAGYAMTVHAVEAGVIVGTALADLAREDGMAGFAVRLDPRTDLRRLRILLGETDETLPVPGVPAGRPRNLAVEDLIAAPQARAWVNGACHIDAEAAGLLPETIIDLLCRDHLGRTAGPVVTVTALARIAAEGYDGTRRLLIDSGEYRHRRIHADRAPGAIFSQTLVAAAAASDFTTSAQRAATITAVPAAGLLALDNEDFITACYRQILHKEPDRGGMVHYLAVLAGGQTKEGVIRHLASELEAISAGVIVTGLPPVA